MRLRIIPVVLILFAASLPPAPDVCNSVVRVDAAAEAEFGALHHQAIAALENLRHASEHRAVSAQFTAF